MERYVYTHTYVGGGNKANMYNVRTGLHAELGARGQKEIVQNLGGGGLTRGVEAV